MAEFMLLGLVKLSAVPSGGATMLGLETGQASGAVR